MGEKRITAALTRIMHVIVTNIGSKIQNQHRLSPLREPCDWVVDTIPIFLCYPETTSNLFYSAGGADILSSRSNHTPI